MHSYDPSFSAPDFRPLSFAQDLYGNPALFMQAQVAPSPHAALLCSLLFIPLPCKWRPLQAAPHGPLLPPHAITGSCSPGGLQTKKKKRFLAAPACPSLNKAALQPLGRPTSSVAAQQPSCLLPCNWRLLKQRHFSPQSCGPPLKPSFSWLLASCKPALALSYSAPPPHWPWYGGPSPPHQTSIFASFPPRSPPSTAIGGSL
ncbi:hypothetical protein GOP47_0002184 [Adiantum capillus-veneris]|uniref:Uncharacterized protein n=1 Tax=Adiantum capillus-veneris TaxID=13818 RepID=A0A9D4V9N8_ADICA|nr:hypothetical protein GOP47_0002184 [Adiantum capillus-veneris]